MVARIHRAAAEQVQREIREATGLDDLPVITVMVRRGDWVILDDKQPAAGMQKGVA